MRYVMCIKRYAQSCGLFVVALWIAGMIIFASMPIYQLCRMIRDWIDDTVIRIDPMIETYGWEMSGGCEMGDAEPISILLVMTLIAIPVYILLRKYVRVVCAWSREDKAASE